MASAVLEALASSSAHGVSKAASSKSCAMRIMWTALFLTSFGFFCGGALHLLRRLLSVQMVKTYQTDKVPFEFPDLYFCPSHPFSGSFPYSLSKSEAELINTEVLRLGELYDQIMSTTFSPDRYNKTSERVRVIINSLPVHLMEQFLMQRLEQSIFASSVKGSEKVRVRQFLTPDNWVCFQILLPDRVREEFATNKNQELRVALFIDPYFYDFQYSGHIISPIVNPVNNETVPFRDWQPFSGVQESMFRSGCQMLITPRGVYPSLEYDSKFRLAPGRSYDIAISMEELTFSEELHGSHCSPNNEMVEFEDHLTGRRAEYNRSYQACLYTEWAKSHYQATGTLKQHSPRPWILRHAPRNENLTEMQLANQSSDRPAVAPDEHGFVTMDTTAHCKRHRPCVYRKYNTAAFSFLKWPGFRNPYAEAFRGFTSERQPALVKLAKIAGELDQGNHSAHSEAAFRHFVSESMFEVRVRADSYTSPQVLMCHSYSVTAFLADIGGLLGLYIGSSLLTVCELLELLYHLLFGSIRRRMSNERKAAASSRETAFSGDEMDGARLHD